MLTNKQKEKIIKKFQIHKDDTGSSEVQIAILTKEIEELAKHLKKHYHDFSSRRGLLKKISQRKKLIKYLKKENPESLLKLAKALGLKVAKQLEEEKKRQKEIEKLQAESEAEEALELNEK